MASMTSSTQLLSMLPYLIPLVLVSLGLVIYALVDLFKRDRRVRGGNKLVWALVILLFQTLGPIVYLFFGRED